MLRQINIEQLIKILKVNQVLKQTQIMGIIKTANNPINVLRILIKVNIKIISLIFIGAAK